MRQASWLNRGGRGSPSREPRSNGAQRTIQRPQRAPLPTPQPSRDPRTNGARRTTGGRPTPKTGSSGGGNRPGQQGGLGDALRALQGQDPKKLRAEGLRQGVNFGPANKHSAKANRPDPRNSKSYQYFSDPANRPTDPAKQREFDMLARIADKRLQGWDKGRNQTYTAVDLDDVSELPEGWVPDPTRGARYKDAPRGTPLNERGIKGANFRAPADLSAPLKRDQADYEGRLTPGVQMDPVDRYARAGYRPAGEPYVKQGVRYMDFLTGDPNNPVKTIQIGDTGDTNLTPPAIPENADFGGVEPSMLRQGSPVANQVWEEMWRRNTGPGMSEIIPRPEEAGQAASAGTMDPLASAQARQAFGSMAGNIAPNTQLMDPFEALGGGLNRDAVAALLALLQQAR